MFKIIFCLNSIHYKLAREVPGFAFVLYTPSRLKKIQSKDYKINLKLNRRYYLFYAILMLFAGKIYLPHFVINPIFFHIARLKKITLIDDGLDFYRKKSLNLSSINKFKVHEYLTFGDNTTRPSWLPTTIKMISTGSVVEKLVNPIEASNLNIVIVSTGITNQIVYNNFGSNFFLKKHSNSNKNLNFSFEIKFINFDISNQLNIFHKCTFMIGISYGAIEIIKYINQTNKILLVVPLAERLNHENFISKVSEFKNVDIIYAQ